MNRRSLLISMGLCLLGLLAGCDRSDSSTSNSTTGGSTTSPTAAGTAAKSKKLLWVQALKGHPVHQMTQIGFTEECKKLGYEPIIVGTDGPDAAGTIGMAEQILAGGDIAGMCVWTGSPTYNTLIAEAGKAGIPVILPHFPVPEGSVPGATGVISCDPAAYAVEAADVIGQQIGGKGKVAISQGSFNTTENLVATSFKKEMNEKYPMVTVLDPIEEGFDVAAAASKAAALMQANPDLAGTLSTTGGGPSTWAGAERDAGRKICAIGMDYTSMNLDLVKTGEIYAVVGQPLWEEAGGAVDLLDKAIKGEKIPWWTKLPAPIITKDKLQPYLDLQVKVQAAIHK